MKKTATRIIAVILAGLVLQVYACAGRLGNMTPAEKAELRSDVITGVRVVAGLLAGLPNADPTVQYIAKYASGVAEEAVKGNSANPTSAAPSR